MLRLIAAVVLACGLTLVVPPTAQASVVLTVRVSATTVQEGARVTFAGRARGARLGSTVRLQRQVGDGWRTVASQRLRNTRSYSFIVTPPRGRRSYRIFKPRGLGQAAAASRVIGVTVRPKPPAVAPAPAPQPAPCCSLTAQATYYLDGLQHSVTRIAISNVGLGGVTVTERRLEARPGSGVAEWAPTGRTVTLPASGTAIVEHVREARGNLFAYDAPAAGTRPAVASDPVAVEVVPVAHELNVGPLLLRDLRMGDSAAVTFEGHEGQVVGMAYGNVEPTAANDDLYFGLYGPDGRPVPDGWFGTQPWEQRYATQSVRLTQTGTYRLDATRYNSAAPDVDSLDVWLSTPMVFETTDPESNPVSLSTAWPGQGILYRYPVSIGELVIQTDSGRSLRATQCPGFRAFSVDGTPILPWDLGDGWYGEHQAGLLSPATGTLSALWTPCVTEPLSFAGDAHRIDTADISIGGPAASLASPRDIGDRVRFRFAGESGQRIEFFHEYAPRERVCCPYLYTDEGTHVLPESDGTTYTLPSTGTYHLLFSDRGTGFFTIGAREVRGK